MATTPNAQLTKLAIGIASVAAIAGISGKIAAKPPVAATQDQTAVAAVGSATNTNTAQGGPSAALPNADQKYQSPVFSGFGHDEEEGESEHEGARSFFGTTPAQPQSGTSGTAIQAPQQQQQTRRTRSKHS